MSGSIFLKAYVERKFTILLNVSVQYILPQSPGRHYCVRPMLVQREYQTAPLLLWLRSPLLVRFA